MPEEAQKPEKSPHALREERILKQWQDGDVFTKTLAKSSPKGEFVFYEGPPTANGRPGIHHLEARAFKDAVPRYKTMQGFHVRRKGGWDTHGLPVELAVEKEIGVKSKKEIEAYGIAAFNQKCKDSVWKYVHEWENFTARMGYWIDLKDPYITYKPNYIESLWNIVAKVERDGLLYKDYKVVPWCPRCGTALSSHELAQGYEDVKDLAVTVKLELVDEPGTYILAWTTTPWTLPGNVALAVGADIQYAKVKADSGTYIVANDRLESVFKDVKYDRIALMKGSELVGKSYKPLYPFLRDNISEHEKYKLANAFKVYPADFVTTTDGTGIVHTAVMYGQEDFELGNKVGLPKHHLVLEDGTFKKETGFLAGKFVKDEETNVEIIKDLAGRKDASGAAASLLFAKEKYAHSYPHCWRCHTPLIYFARDSWYIRMSSLRDKLVAGNEEIHWEPDYIKNGRFGEWLREIKDWAISRERYWGTPLPVWQCHKCQTRHVVGSIAEVSRTPRNNYWVMRHGEAENNAKHVLNGDDSKQYHLTDHGRQQVEESASPFHQGKKIDLVYISPFLRVRETTDILKKHFGWKDEQIIVDDRLHEINFGNQEGVAFDAFKKAFSWTERFDKMPPGGEHYGDIKRRMGDFLYDIEHQHEGKNILIISHGTPLMMLMAAAQGFNRAQSTAFEIEHYIHKANICKLDFTILPHNTEYELDLHRPFIDDVKIGCTKAGCDSEMVRVKEVMDVWFDSGAMPFAQNHYPFENKKLIDGGLFKKATSFPADFISEAIDQTRGWFYTLHAVANLMGKSHAYKNVISLGHLLDAQGKKMSKSIGNVVDPWLMMDKYGADALRFWMYSINQPGESKNFDEKTVDEIIKKVFNLAANVTSFYKMYAIGEVQGTGERLQAGTESTHVLDRWIIARLNQTVSTVTENMDKYVFLDSTRAIRDFIADLSQWYLRRSRDRFKEEGADKAAALATTKYILQTLAKIMAPFTPFFAEELYSEAGGSFESVHLETWPLAGKVDEALLKDMVSVRTIASQGLEARMKAKINVRQPLASFSTTADVTVLDEIIKDEINVKEIRFGAAENALDTNITPELKEEGDVRELIRRIQDLRKEKGLSVGDRAKLVATADLQTLISKRESELKKATGLTVITFGDTFSLEK